VEPKNSQQLADCVNRLLRDELLRRKLGANGRRRVEKHFSWTYIAQQTKTLYQELIDSRK